MGLLKESVGSLGVSLGGAKSGRTAAAIVKYSRSEGRYYLQELRKKINSEQEKSSDQKLIEFLKQHQSIKKIGIDAPLQAPKCFRCRLKCPGEMNCTVPEVVWKRELYREVEKAKKKKLLKRGFTPYTERCVDLFLKFSLEEPFEVSPALGANAAPKLARAMFLQKQLDKQSFVEVSPRVSLWRIGRTLNLKRSSLRNYKHPTQGIEHRLYILEAWAKKGFLFVYDQDLKLLVEFPEVFDALLSAITMNYLERSCVELKPAGFPKKASWVFVPKEGA